MSGIQPGPAGRPAAPASNGLAVAALVLGILSVIFEWLGLVTLAMAVMAVVLGSAGISRAARSGTGCGQALAGVILGVAGLAAYLAWGVASFGVFLLI